jgi:hypothetical protein
VRHYQAEDQSHIQTPLSFFSVHRIPKSTALPENGEAVMV